jgi:threonylcarbamoyladenosine tRNA methylthiotransferase MtaB
LKTVSFCTLGCKVNAYDSAFMRELFLKNGYSAVDFGRPADIAIVNTCTVTSVADKKSRAAIRRAAKAGKVIVAGCLAQKKAGELLDMEGVSAAVGTDKRGDIVSIAERLLSGEERIDATNGLEACSFEKMSLSAPAERTRGIIKIQEGCNNFCSYCIIPYVRGHSRSRRIADIVKEAYDLAQSGVKELVITGIHIASYSDEGYRLGDVISELDKAGVRIRLGSIEPVFLGEAFIKQAASAKNLCPHFHLSLQSGSAGVLKRMNRKYTPDEYAGFVGLLRKYYADPAITTDIIAGFPGETEREHEETKAFIERIAFSRIHVFPFSAREGTKAFNMQPKVPKNIAKERALELIESGDVYEKKYIQSRIGKTAQVLFEDGSKEFSGCLEGYSERYVRVAAKARKNELKAVALKEISGKVIYGTDEEV